MSVSRSEQHATLAGPRPLLHNVSLPGFEDFFLFMVKHVFAP